MQTCILPGLRAPNPQPLSERAERGKRHAKGRGVSIRLSLWNSSPHRPGRGLRPPLLDPPRSAERICPRRLDGVHLCSHRASGSGRGRWAVSALCQSGCAVTPRRAARNRSTVVPGAAPALLFFFAPLSRRVSFSLTPKRKRNGGRGRSPLCSQIYFEYAVNEKDDALCGGCKAQLPAAHKKPPGFSRRLSHRAIAQNIKESFRHGAAHGSSY